MTTEGKLESIRTANDASFAGFYSIYLEAMPRRERKSAQQIASMVTREDYEFLVLKQGDSVLGFSLFFVPRHEDFCLLEYMAVAKEHRNRGLGARLFQQSIAHIFSNRPSVPVLLEVDSDREASPDRKIRRRRQAFYKRLGCLRIADLEYQLALRGSGPPPEMDLLVYDGGRKSVISPARLQHWLQVIYRDVYDAPPDDPRIAAMTAGLSDPVQLE